MFIILFFCFSFLFVEYISRHFNGEKEQKNVQIFLCFVLLFVFFGFRNLSVLNDTSHYYRYARHLFSSASFENMPWYHFVSGSTFEEGFQIFVRFIGRFISKEPYSLILITSLITTISLLCFLSKSTPHIAFTVFVLLTSTLLLGYYSAMRQSLAVSFSYLVYYCYKRGYFTGTVICGIIAYYFHHSSLILLLPILLYHIPFNKRNMILLSGATIVTAWGIYSILSFLGYGDSRYLKTGLEREAVPLAQILDTLFIFLCLIFYYVCKNKYGREKEDNKLYLSFALSSLIVNIWAIPCLALFRFSMFFSQYAVVLFVNSLYDAECGNRLKIFKWSVVAVLFIRISIVLIFRNEWHHLIPYSSFDFDLVYQKTHFGY